MRTIAEYGTRRRIAALACLVLLASALAPPDIPTGERSILQGPSK